MMAQLAAVQQLLLKLITAPEGARSAVEQLDTVEYANFESLISGDSRFSAIERLDVYANMYFYRLLDCLKEDFPALAQMIGADHFHNLITDYLLAHPPRHFSLRHLGDRLPEFLGQHRVCEKWPGSADLARFEWALVEAFDAAGGEPIDASAFAGIEEDKWAGLRFGVTPSLQVLSLAWSVLPVWEAQQRGEPLPLLGPEPQALRVWRRDFGVHYRVVEPPELAALKALGDGATFAEICVVVGDCTDEAHAADVAATLLAQWVADGLIVSLESA